MRKRDFFSQSGFGGNKTYYKSRNLLFLMYSKHTLLLLWLPIIYLLCWSEPPKIIICGLTSNLFSNPFISTTVGFQILREALGSSGCFESISPGSLLPRSNFIAWGYHTFQIAFAMKTFPCSTVHIYY